MRREGWEQTAAKMTPAQIAEVQDMEREWKPKRQSAQVSWYRKGADQGFADAQYNLGIMYAKGEGVPQDYVQAHKWWNLAAARYEASETVDRNMAVKNRDIVAAKMTPAQIEKAQELASEWKPR